MSERQRLAQAAYEAYVAANPFGETSLDWDELDDAYIAAWRAAVDVVAAAVYGHDMQLAIEAARRTERQTLRERILACQVAVELPHVGEATAAVLMSDLVAILMGDES